MEPPPERGRTPADGRATPTPPASPVEHQVRNALNALHLAVAVLPAAASADDLLYWLDAVERAADRCAAAMDLFDRPPGADETVRVDAARTESDR